eukprot:Gregarina_sp_Poly_1__5585@NODE_294_length_9872_cov_66_125038_g254_i0_p2_GENE_NODE_294_length_9872_cov_66_125038_g254_i0NODE_294_length_9872_cov_66_125038_g254_i0_p2_ORF_typecomplete_len665_score95_88GCFC/PF07842_12/1_1e27Gpatch/PF01585_23/3_5e03Gpatch/PF01585_23/1_8e08TIP_N/PF12457_8/0_0004TIP_N/PF12457_8/5_5e03_NODE_294_length_9872_cov_66_125038_g254_i055037497
MKRIYIDSFEEDSSSDDSIQDVKRKRFATSQGRHRSKEDNIYGVFLEEMGFKEDSSNPQPDETLFHKVANLKEKSVTFVSSQSQTRPSQIVTEHSPQTENILSEYSSSVSTSSSDEEYEKTPKTIGREIFRKNVAPPPADVENSRATKKYKSQYGIGFTMIQKMGFVGGGLGAEGQGRSKPIEVKKRAKFKGLHESGRAGVPPLHAVWPEEDELDGDGEGDELESSIKKEPSAKEKKRRLAEQRRQRREKLRARYSDFQQVTETVDCSDSTGGDQTSVPIRIVDLRGPEATVIADGERNIGSIWGNLNITANDSGETAGEPKMHITSSQNDILLSYDTKRLTESDIDEKRITRIQEVQNAVHDCFNKLPRGKEEKSRNSILEKYSSHPHSSGDDSVLPTDDEYSLKVGGARKKPDPPSLPAKQVSAEMDVTELTSIFRGLFRSHLEELKELKIFHLIGESLLQPLLQVEAIKSWNIRENPTSFMKTQLLFWRRFLSHSQHGKDDTLFSQVIWESIVEAHVIPFVEREWSPIDDCEIMLSLCHDWARVWLCSNHFRRFLSQVIVPKLRNTLKQWEPASSCLPPHLWIHPWMPILGDDLLNEFWPVLLDKYLSSLRQWDPADRSAGVMVSTWKHVWPISCEQQVMAIVWDKIGMFLASAEVSPLIS